MTTLRKRFWLWLGKVLKVENGGVIDGSYTAPANQVPVVVSLGKELFVKDPFGVTEEQQVQVYEQLKTLGQTKKAIGFLQFEEKTRHKILREIGLVDCSEHWFSRDKVQDDHWDAASTQAINYLQSLGFRDNADIQRYLDKGELPNAK